MVLQYKMYSMVHNLIKDISVLLLQDWLGSHEDHINWHFEIVEPSKWKHMAMQILYKYLAAWSRVPNTRCFIFQTGMETTGLPDLQA